MLHIFFQYQYVSTKKLELISVYDLSPKQATEGDRQQLGDPSRCSFVIHFVDVYLCIDAWDGVWVGDWEDSRSVQPSSLTFCFGWV